ncbi:MAG TPA: CoA transferase [Candidatus Binataceae bacterium]|nr:CoA transferase [Candidatus Binataceae bacterium]
MEKADFYREARYDIPGPLNGIRVLELTTSWAGPMCACLMADLGADVIKVEAPDGEVTRKLAPFFAPRIGYLYATVNRNKRSLTLDLHEPEAREIYLKIAARSDVVVQNFRPGTLDRWGIGYEDVRRVKPDIVYVSISGFGQWGPDHDRAAYDPLAEAESGFMSLNGSPDGPPVKAANYLCDDLSGLHGALSALAALRHRDQTGEGQHIDVALLDAMLFQSNGMLTLGAIGYPLQRNGNRSNFTSPSEVFRCKDGSVYLYVLLDTHWRKVAALMGRPEVGTDPHYATAVARVAHHGEVEAMVAEWMAERTAKEVLADFAREGVPAAPVRTYPEAACDPHVLARDMLHETAHEGGMTVPITAPAAKFSRTPLRIRNSAPALGAHNDEILAGVGIDAEARARLRSSKLI